MNVLQIVEGTVEGEGVDAGGTEQGGGNRRLQVQAGWYPAGEEEAGETHQ